MKKKVSLVTGGAGFIGSNLINYLLEQGDEIICIDNLLTGDENNLLRLRNHPYFQLVKQDIREDFEIDNVDRVFHFAAIASPHLYLKDPIETSRINFEGTYKMLELSKKCNAKFLFASTSEVYGKLTNIPITENILGILNTQSTRSCYFESKRAAESLCFDFARKYNLEVRVARIFNTYGPNMSLFDQRVISNFIRLGLRKEALIIYGDGSQTRSFCYISDLIDGLLKFMNSTFSGPINLGSPDEIKINELAKRICQKLKLKKNIKYKLELYDEPKYRKPSIMLAKKILNWEPKIGLDDGLDLTIKSYKNRKSIL